MAGLRCAASAVARRNFEPRGTAAFDSLEIPSYPRVLCQWWSGSNIPHLSRWLSVYCSVKWLWLNTEPLLFYPAHVYILHKGQVTTFLTPCCTNDGGSLLFIPGFYTRNQKPLPHPVCYHCVACVVVCLPGFLALLLLWVSRPSSPFRFGSSNRQHMRQQCQSVQLGHQNCSWELDCRREGVSLFAEFHSRTYR